MNNGRTGIYKQEKIIAKTRARSASVFVHCFPVFVPFIQVKHKWFSSTILITYTTMSYCCALFDGVWPGSPRRISDQMGLCHWLNYSWIIAEFEKVLKNQDCISCWSDPITNLINPSSLLRVVNSLIQTCSNNSEQAARIQLVGG